VKAELFLEEIKDAYPSQIVKATCTIGDCSEGSIKGIGKRINYPIEKIRVMLSTKEGARGRYYVSPIAIINVGGRFIPIGSRMVLEIVIK